MTEFAIKQTSSELDNAIWQKINQKTKPLGALGQLESIAFKIAKIQETLTPTLTKPTIALFAGDHGIALTGMVNPYPQSVTYQMVLNFLNGGAALNVFARQNDIDVRIIDAGVNYDFGEVPNLINAKMGMGTANYQTEKAMDIATCQKALLTGAEVVEEIAKGGTNVIGFGEMGISNTSAAALIMSTICDLPIATCVGKGTGADDELLVKKIKTLEQVSQFHGLNSDSDSMEILASYGGFEIVQMAGGMLKAAELGMIIMVDGFISTAAMLAASKLNPLVLDYALFAHQSEEKGHAAMLEHLQAKPFLNLGMRLGEGSGCAVAYPIVKMAVAFLNEMASFESANVDEAS